MPTDAVTAEHPDSADRLAYTLTEFCRAVPCSRPTAYAAIRAGRLTAKKLGTRTLIPAEAARAFIANLPSMRAAA
jgi:excisionase family DNA binding protein